MYDQDGSGGSDDSGPLNFALGISVPADQMTHLSRITVSFVLSDATRQQLVDAFGFAPLVSQLSDSVAPRHSRLLPPSPKHSLPPSTWRSLRA